jgi:hypothetical protein
MASDDRCWLRAAAVLATCATLAACATQRAGEGRAYAPPPQAVRHVAEPHRAPKSNSLIAWFRGLFQGPARRPASPPAMVKLAPPPAAPRTALVASPSPPRPQTRNRFVLAGTFADPANARRAAAMLAPAGPVRIEPTEHRGRTLYLVLIDCPGPARTARVVRARVAEIGFADAVVRRE